MTLSALSFAVAFGALTVGSAHAQVPLQPPFSSYAAKFTCGPVAKLDSDVVVGTYATAINIHNPQALTSVSFIKKIVLANEEGAASGRIVVKSDKLGPDIAERVDCLLIYRLLDVSPATHIEGFVILEIPPVPGTTGAGFIPQLDVVGVYSARGASGEVTGLDVVTYQPKGITH